MGGMVMKLIPVVAKHLLGPLGVSIVRLWLTFLGLIATPNSHNRGLNLPQAVHPLRPPTPPSKLHIHLRHL